jgi:hypothetical protein
VLSQTKNSPFTILLPPRNHEIHQEARRPYRSPRPLTTYITTIMEDVWLMPSRRLSTAVVVDVLENMWRHPSALSIIDDDVGIMGFRRMGQHKGRLSLPKTVIDGYQLL